MKKNTMQSLADALGVSRITVWKALNHKEGVSETLRQKIIELSWQNKNWCEANRQKLYKVFLQRINHAESTHDFFGDWNHYEGRSDVGYYLGCEMIKKLSTRYSLLELANFEEADILEQLKSMAR